MRNDVVTIKQVQQYWDKRPCNIRHGISPVGSSEWSREVTVRKYYIEPHIPGFAQFDRWTGKRVLEIGCGIGTDTIQFCRAKVKHITAIDLSGESLKLAKMRANISGYHNVEFQQGNAEINVPGHAYDLAYSFGVLHHTPHPERALENIHYALKDDGELRIMLYAKWSLKYILRNQPEAQAGCPIANYYSAREVKSLLADCGFKVESITKAHIFPWKISDYVQHRYVRCWYYDWMPEGLFSWLERRMGHHLLIVARKS